MCYWWGCTHTRAAVGNNAVDDDDHTKRCAGVAKKARLICIVIAHMYIPYHVVIGAHGKQRAIQTPSMATAVLCNLLLKTRCHMHWKGGERTATVAIRGIRLDVQEKQTTSIVYVLQTIQTTLFALLFKSPGNPCEHWAPGAPRATH